MSLSALGFPQKYVQGPDAVDKIGQLVAGLGSKAMVLGDDLVLGLLGERVITSLTNASMESTSAIFRGECCRSEFDRLADICEKNHCDVVIALGGGKAIDTGKVVAAQVGAELVVVPTIASTDGPVSSIAVEYTSEHVHIGVLRFNRNPSVIVVDTKVVAGAPTRLLVSGMGDALATWFEARACDRSAVLNFHDGRISPIAMMLAKSCYETVIHHGVAAVQAADNNQTSEAVERIIEANTFLSGVGFENTGVAAAHALDGAISRYSNNHRSEHGERVGVGVLFLLSLEGAEEQEIVDLLTFYKEVGLPCSLTDLGLTPFSDSELSKLVKLVLRDGSPIRNMSKEVAIDESAVFNALDRWRGTTN